MSDETTITSTTLSRSTSEILNRVIYRGERFIVQRGGKIVARIEPAVPSDPISLEELARRLAGTPMPMEGFADDLEKIQAEQTVEGEPPWPSS